MLLSSRHNAETLKLKFACWLQRVRTTPLIKVTQLENDKTKFMSELAIMKQDKHEDLHSLRDKLASLKKDSDAMLVQHKKDLAHVDAIKHERDQFKHDCE